MFWLLTTNDSGKSSFKFLSASRSVFCKLPDCLPLGQCRLAHTQVNFVYSPTQSLKNKALLYWANYTENIMQLHETSISAINYQPMGFAVRVRSAGQNTGQRATKGTVLTSQSLSPWCDCRRLGSTLASWRWQDINVGNPLWRRALFALHNYLNQNTQLCSVMGDVCGISSDR